MKMLQNPVMNSVSPIVIEERKLNTIGMDIFSRLMMERIIFLGEEIDAEVASIIQAQLLYLEYQDHNKPITMYINSPGGEVYAGLGIYDTMQFIKPKVNTVCVGLAASMAAILLAAGDTRVILPHGKVMIHQPWGGAGGTAADILIAAKEIENMRKTTCEIISKHTGVPYEKVYTDVDRDNWLTAQEALEYHIVDKIIENRE